MALLAPQQIVAAGAVPAFVAAAGGGDTVVPRPGLYLEVVNGGGASITVTIDDPNSVAPAGATQFNPDTTHTIAAGARRKIAMNDVARFTNPATGVASISYSGVASVTVGAFYV